MGITNKAISTKFLKIIIRTNHGQTEIVCLDVTSHAACRYRVYHSSCLFVEDESLALKWLFQTH